MDKSSLNGISVVLPFDADYIKVGKGKTLKWNLMDASGKLISDTWFSEITKKADKSIIVALGGRKKTETTTLANVESLRGSGAFLKLLSLKVIANLDSATIEPCNRGKYIAKAKAYGMVVYIDADGNIYDENDVLLRFSINTADSERIYRSANAFNRKMHYDYKPHGTLNAVDTMVSTFNNKISAWVFYFCSDKISFITTKDPLVANIGTKKWTDKLVFRVIKELLTEDVLTALCNTFGDGKMDTYHSPGDTETFNTLTWQLDFTDVDKIINALDAF